MEIQAETIWLFETSIQDPYFIGEQGGVTVLMQDDHTIRNLTINKVAFKIDGALKGGLKYDMDFGGEPDFLGHFNGNIRTSYHIMFNVPFGDPLYLLRLLGMRFSVMWQTGDGGLTVVFAQFTAERLSINNHTLQRVTLSTVPTHSNPFRIMNEPSLNEVVTVLAPTCQPTAVVEGGFDYFFDIPLN